MRYKRLAVSRRGLGKWHTLWLGDDHLLAVESTGYSEDYVRYYLKDIQAIVTRRSLWGTALNIIFGSALFFSVLVGIVNHNARSGLTPEELVAGIFGGFFLLLLLWNLFSGPTCRCHIRTSVSIAELPALYRIKRVKKTLDRLRPMIGQLQGGISRMEIAELTKRAKDAPHAILSTDSTEKTAASAPQLVETLTSSYRGELHRPAFLLLIADAGLSSLQMLHNFKALMGTIFFVSFTFLILSIIALVKQNDSLIATLAKWMTWGGVAVMTVGAMVSYFFMIFLNLDKMKGGVVTQNDLFDFYAAIQPAEHHTYASFLLVYAVVAAGIGIVGLVALGRGRGIAARHRP